MSGRQRARETAVRMLFQWEMSKEPPETVKRLYWRSVTPAPGVREAAEALFDGVVAQVEEIDPLIRRHAEHWRLERMSVVDRNILRLAIYEFLARDVPAKVVIHQAVEIAHRYSSADAGAFINGVLDAVRKAIHAEKQDAK